MKHLPMFIAVVTMGVLDYGLLCVDVHYVLRLVICVGTGLICSALARRWVLLSEKKS